MDMRMMMITMNTTQMAMATKSPPSSTEPCASGLVPVGMSVVVMMGDVELGVAGSVGSPGVEIELSWVDSLLGMAVVGGVLSIWSCVAEFMVSLGSVDSCMMGGDPDDDTTCCWATSSGGVAQTAVTLDTSSTSAQSGKMALVIPRHSLAAWLDSVKSMSWNSTAHQKQWWACEALRAGVTRVDEIEQICSSPSPSELRILVRIV